MSRRVPRCSPRREPLPLNLRGGDPAGTDNTFTATSHGTVSSTNTVAGCLAHRTDAVVVIWHSDGQAHGTTPGTLGITWHNAVIAQVPV